MASHEWPVLITAALGMTGCEHTPLSNDACSDGSCYGGETCVGAECVDAGLSTEAPPEAGPSADDTDATALDSDLPPEESEDILGAELLSENLNPTDQVQFSDGGIHIETGTHEGEQVNAPPDKDDVPEKEYPPDKDSDTVPNP